MARSLMKGNEAMATAAIAAGCKCFFGYPITPQNEIPEFMSKAMYESGGKFVQAGISAPAKYDIPSCFKATPGDDDDVIARTPAPPAP